MMAEWALLAVGMTVALDARASPAPGPAVEALRHRVAAILERERIPGAGIALVRGNDLVWSGGVGMADAGGRRPVEADTPFRVGSISKTVTAIAVMRLVEQGRISLDSPLRDLASEVAFENPWEADQPVRLSHLLEHTAGFEFARLNEWFDDQAEPRTLVEALRVNPRSRRSRWAPGTRAAYSNEGYLIAGHLLERVTGLDFDAAVQELALDPLRMEGAAFRATPGIRARLAQGHGWPEPSGRPVAYEEDMMRPAANLIATPQDLGRLVEFFLGRGTVEGVEILAPATVARMEERRTLPHPGLETQYGLGTELYEHEGFVGRGHVGTTFGFEAAFRYFPDLGTGWAVLLNGGGSGARRAREAIEAEIFALLVQHPPPPRPASGGTESGDLSRWVGFYRDVTPILELLAPLTSLGGVDVSLAAEGLVIRDVPALSIRSHLPGARPPVRIEPAGGSAFRRAGEVAPSYLFTRTRGGEDTIATGSGLLVKTSGLAVSLSWWLLVTALLLSLSALAILPHALAQWWLHDDTSRFGFGILPALSALTILALLALVYLSPQQWGRVNATTVSFWALSWLYLPLSVLSLAGAVILARGPGGIGLKAYMVAVGISGVGLAAFAWRAGWIGLRTWRW